MQKRDQTVKSEFYNIKPNKAIYYISNSSRNCSKIVFMINRWDTPAGIGLQFTLNITPRKICLIITS